VKKKFFL